MKNLLKLEELGMFLIALYAFTYTGYSWWWFLGLILLPDVGMLGYLINPRIGAISYNIFHHKGLAVAILFAGLYFGIPELHLAGIILFAHSSLDRVFAYGLKYFDSFQHTHLGWLNQGNDEF